MEKNIAIKVENISKTFKVPHEKIASVRGAFVNMFNKKNYEEFKALDDVSFEIKKGEFFGIVGRNGSGKSTLLKILAKVYQSDNGKIKINGRISPFLELGIGFNPELSGRDNIYLNATILGLTKKQIDEKFNDIVDFSELERFIDQKLKNYSSGMRVRLAFSVSIHANREILLMDEVLAVGDINFQQKCLQEFNRYRDLGKTVVLVTHNIETIQKYCDRAMLLKGGKIEVIGDPVEVGNEYTLQNMSEEEKRMEDNNKNEKVSSLEKNRDMKSRIKRVELINEEGDFKNVFITGGFLKIRVYFIAPKKNDDFDIGISLQNGEGVYLFGYNTEIDKFIFNKEGAYIDFIIEKLPLLQGSYLINVASFRNTIIHDFKPKIINFRVYSLNSEAKYKGIININHEWRQ